ncbi:MAG TPA: DUF3024 domain-containing protein [Burkholderiaceae bacterium]|jgi:hypothetical protein
MSFHDLDRKRIDKAIAAFLMKRRPPVHLRSQVDFGHKVSGQSIELFEIRPKWDDSTTTIEIPFAKATYVKASNLWKVYWRRADMKWHSYQPMPAVSSAEEFLNLVDRDEHCCFFG